MSFRLTYEGRASVSEGVSLVAGHREGGQLSEFGVEERLQAGGRGVGGVEEIEKLPACWTELGDWREKREICRLKYFRDMESCVLDTAQRIVTACVIDGVLEKEMHFIWMVSTSGSGWLACVCVWCRMQCGIWGLNKVNL